MNRNEKNMQTKRKIMEGALQEFGEKSYGEASLNTVSAAGGLSKGIIYHYFKDKDELYLACIKECFDALTDSLTGLPLLQESSVELALQHYFDARSAFFEAHPCYLRLFCNAIIQPPAHLRAAVAEITRDFNALNLSVLTRLLNSVQLRTDVTVEEVVEVFREYQDFVHTRFQMQALEESTLQEHEARCRRSLKILLYGVIERETR